MEFNYIRSYALASHTFTYFAYDAKASTSVMTLARNPPY